MPHLTHLPGEVRRHVLIHRRPLAALLVALAVLAALRATQPPAPATSQVWTAAHDLPAGRVLAHDDLRRTTYAPGSVPAGAVGDPAAVVGRTLAAPLRRGVRRVLVRRAGGCDRRGEDRAHPEERGQDPHGHVWASRLPDPAVLPRPRGRYAPAGTLRPSAVRGSPCGARNRVT